MRTWQMFVVMIILIGMILSSCNKSATYHSLFKQYKNIEGPVPFAPELAVKDNTYKGAFSDDYSTFYFFRKVTPDQEDYRILESIFTGDKWSEPKTISFSDDNSDVYVMPSVIEKDKLFFTSYRRISGDTSHHPNANFWYAQKMNGQWSAPEPLKEANLIRNYNSQPCMTKSGNIYFTSHTPDWRQTLTYKLEFKDGSYMSPVLFKPLQEMRMADTTNTYWEICVSPDENYLIMVISEKDGPAKLFLSNHMKGDEWTAPRYLGDIIQHDVTGNFPYITKDGKFLIFTKEFSSFYILPTKMFLQQQ